MPTVETLQELRDACHNYIGKAFKDQRGLVIGEIRRTVIDKGTLLVCVELNKSGRAQVGTDTLVAPVLKVRRP